MLINIYVVFLRVEMEIEIQSHCIGMSMTVDKTLHYLKDAYRCCWLFRELCGELLSFFGLNNIWLELLWVGTQSLTCTPHLQNLSNDN